MEADRWNYPAALACGLARRVREIQADPTISRALPRDGSRLVPGNLHLGMGPSPARTADRDRLRSAARCFLGDRMAAGAIEAEASRNPRPWRAARRGRLVDGGVGSVRPGRGGAGAAR